MRVSFQDKKHAFLFKKTFYTVRFNICMYVL